MNMEGEDEMEYRKFLEEKLPQAWPYPVRYEQDERRV
jgi:hypothetical protein